MLTSFGVGLSTFGDRKHMSVPEARTNKLKGLCGGRHRFVRDWWKFSGAELATNKQVAPDEVLIKTAAISKWRLAIGL